MNSRKLFYLFSLTLAFLSYGLINLSFNNDEGYFLSSQLSTEYDDDGEEDAETEKEEDQEEEDEAIAEGVIEEDD